MMINAVPAREMRVLTDAEIAMVAGGLDPNEAGVDGLVGEDALWLSPDGVFVSSTMDTPFGTYSTIAFDSNGNGLYDIIWMDMGNGEWICSVDGSAWGICSPPTDLIRQYLENYEEPETVGGD